MVLLLLFSVLIILLLLVLLLLLHEHNGWIYGWNWDMILRLVQCRNHG